MTLKSPRLSLSRKQKPPFGSTSWRTSSSVGWSPQLLTSGIDRSSRKRSSSCPTAGRSSCRRACRARPRCRAGTCRASSPNEKLTFLSSICSSVQWRRRTSAPSTSWPCPSRRSSARARAACGCSRAGRTPRVESIVGTSSVEKSCRPGVRPTLGGLHAPTPSTRGSRSTRRWSPSLVGRHVVGHGAQVRVEALAVLGLEHAADAPGDEKMKSRSSLALDVVLRVGEVRVLEAALSSRLNIAWTTPMRDVFTSSVVHWR